MVHTVQCRYGTLIHFGIWHINKLLNYLYIIDDWVQEYSISDQPMTGM